MPKTVNKPKARAAGRTEGSQQRVVGCEQVRAAILAEPELPGEMPDALWWMWRNADRKAAVEMMRVCVRETKRGILERLGLEASNERAMRTPET